MNAQSVNQFFSGPSQEFCINRSKRTTEDLQHIECIEKIVNVITKVSATAFAILTVFMVAALISPVIPLAALGWIIHPAIFSLALSLIGAVADKILVSIRNSFILSNPTQDVDLSPSAENFVGKVEMIPTQNCAETQKFRLDLIKKAQYNIILSGNYCGGHAFDEVLDLIEKRLEENSDLKVVILSSPNYIKSQNELGYGCRNNVLIEQLSKKYPDQFSLINTPIFVYSDSDLNLKLATNHTKTMVVDYGKYFISGGSAVKDNFVGLGMDERLLLRPCVLRKFNLDQNKIVRASANISILVTKANQFVEQLPSTFQMSEYRERLSREIRQLTYCLNTLGEKTSVSTMTRQAEKMLDCLKYFSTIMDEDYLVKAFTRAIEVLKQIMLHAKPSSVLEALMPGNFRDMDFVFCSNDPDSSLGRTLYQQMLALCYRWEKTNESLESSDVSNTFNQDEVRSFPAFTDEESLDVIEGDSVTMRLLKTKSLRSDEVETYVPEFHKHEKASHPSQMKLLFSGPEHSESDYAKELLHRIREAQEEIVINHMYFHPTKELMQALVQAVKERGVRIKIITNGIHRGCPSSHLIFGPTNKYYYHELYSRLPESLKDHLTVYEYEQRKKGNHKKVFVFDKQFVVGGSSNFGYKSLVSTSDHEVNFSANSEELAEHTLEIFDEDLSKCRAIDLSSISMSFTERVQVYQYMAGAPLWG